MSFFSVRRIDFEVILKQILNLDLWRIIEESKWALPRGGGKWDAVFRVRQGNNLTRAWDLIENIKRENYNKCREGVSEWDYHILYLKYLNEVFMFTLKVKWERFWSETRMWGMGTSVEFNLQ